MRGFGIGVAVAVVGFMACGQAPDPHWPSRHDDVEAWTGAKLIELETHEKFSTMKHETRELSDGTTMWVFPECQKGAVHCSSGAVAVPGKFMTTAFGNSTCVADEDKCCQHQFIVKDGKVLQYMPRGPKYQCRSNCKTRPASVQAGCH